MPVGGELSDRPADERQIPNTSHERYLEMVETARYIAAGDIFQVVLSQRVDVPSNVHPFTVYRALRTINRRHTCSISISSTTRSLGRRLSF